MNFADILTEYGPITLTESVRKIKTEPFVLTSRLGKNVIPSTDETCVFEVEEGTYNLAPVGYSGDPATNVNISRRRRAYTVTPPQIFLKDRITAREIVSAREIGQNPINMTAGDKDSAFMNRIAIKQQGLIRLVDRRVEWMFAQAMHGKINYVSETGRAFEIDYKLPRPITNIAAGADAWNRDGDPLDQLRLLGKEFKRINNQLEPDLIIMGSNAGDKFMSNESVKDWRKSAGDRPFRNTTPLGQSEAQPLGNLEGSDLFEYSATYENDKGNETPYLEPDYVYLTSSSLWRLYYGAIMDFDAGNPPLVAGSLFSKMKVSEDGKAMDLYVESHPLPVVVSNTAVIRAKVVD